MKVILKKIQGEEEIALKILEMDVIPSIKSKFFFNHEFHTVVDIFWWYSEKDAEYDFTIPYVEIILKKK